MKMINYNTAPVISKNETILSVLKIMDNKDCKVLIIVDGIKFINIVSIGDVQRAIINKKPLDSSILDTLRSDITIANEGEDLSVIKNKMLEQRFELMPIINQNKELVNILYWKDLFEEKRGEIHEPLNIPVVIMAGGQGTRLKPLTNVIPKPLIPIGKKTIIETILDKFESIGCSDFHLSVNYKSEILEYYLNDFNYNISYFKEDKPLGTIGSVSLLKNKIKSTFFVSNCDILVEQDYREVYKYHKTNNNEITIISALKNYKIPYGIVNTSNHGLLQNMEEKPEYIYQINTGIYILEPHLIDEIPINKMFHITHLIDKVMKRGGRVGVFPVAENSWTDIGEWNEYLKLIKI